MTHFADWLSPTTLRPLALALLHFFWQGAALAALAYALMALCRSAATRYAVAVAAMILMVSAPVGTFFVLEAEKPAGTPPGARDTVVLSSAHKVSFAPGAAIHASTSHEATPAYFLWLVEAWFAGVMLLSLRSAGGFLAVERLRRKESTPLERELLELCFSLQRRMGLTRVVRYCHCVHLDAPAVAGWIRPVVFLPMTALTGLSAAQLEAVIAHELAHIRRFDAFVNLFQIAVETLLFYHPAVWWLSRRLRIEREMCADELAVAATGKRLQYAQALEQIAGEQQAWIDTRERTSKQITALDARLTDKGFHIYLTGETYVTYYPRESATALFWQYFNIGRGRARNFLKHRRNMKCMNHRDDG